MQHSDLAKINEIIKGANQGGSNVKKSYDYYLLLKIYDDDELVSEMTLKKDNLNSKVILTGFMGRVSLSAYSYDHDKIITELYYKVVRQK